MVTRGDETVGSVVIQAMYSKYVQPVRIPKIQDKMRIIYNFYHLIHKGD